MLRAGAVLLLSVIALTGCGRSTRVDASRTLELGVTEFRLTPQHVSVPAGELFIHVHNYGRLTHNLVVATGGHPLAVAHPIAPGESTWIGVVLAPGSYLMTSNMLSDQALGTYGTITVTR